MSLNLFFMMKEDPNFAMLVTDKLASLYIEATLRVREQQAIGTAHFLAEELRRVRARLEEQEKASADSDNFNLRMLGKSANMELSTYVEPNPEGRE